jgi:hypothetical protein
MLGFSFAIISRQSKASKGKFQNRATVFTDYSDDIDLCQIPQVIKPQISQITQILDFPHQ